MRYVEANGEVMFCCDGYGNSGICDPWCDQASPEEQERWALSRHLGVVDFSAFPYECDHPDCCGTDDADDDA